MPIGLKNAGATYQRMATTLLHDIMHNEVEVYVDDMIVKSKDREGHIINLRKFFERIKEYRLRLIPQKCTFGVTARKLLGFLVSDRGIEVYPSKIKAILESPPPKSEKEIRGIPRIRFEVCGAVSNFYAKNPIEVDDGKENFLDEDILDIELRAGKMYFDGAVNQYGNVIGVLLITVDGSHVPLAIKLNFVAANNMAEYEVCIARMEALQELGVKEVEVFGDSTLVIAQAQKL
ncbi:uncharacterized protein LOC112036481 [Quercus suber]|uniref:uncharacterized protein LOC112036481 n=1 Tax=Quercus suber TaxID=58331 RepID=UPI000CE1C87C|nr:uncharacterized protein LOC112036481 [Quercus suber]